MPELTASSPARAANDIDANQANASAADEFVNTGKAFLLADHTNGGGTTATLTIAVQKTVDGLAVADKTITIGAAETHLLGPFPTEYYNDVDGKVQLAMSGGYSDVTYTLILPTT